MKNKLTIISFATICFIAIVAVFGFYLTNTQNVAASAIDGQTYYATSTTNILPAATALIKTGPGSLGSVVITGTNTGVMYLYDATTSDVTQRATSLSSSTILIAQFPASPTLGTYTFDVTLKYGLLYAGVGTVATSTITYK